MESNNRKKQVIRQGDNSMIVVRKILFLTVALVIALAGKTFSDTAEKEHGHKTPHGGVVQEAEGCMLNC